MLYGVLGSGQLAWMLEMAAKKAGHQLRFIDPKLGSPMEQQQALEGCDFVTCESEFLDYPNWREALAKSSVFPSLSLMSQLSDKWEQKKLFNRYCLPTAQGNLIDSFPMQNGVAKWSRQGYDGYGNFVIKDGDRNKKEMQEKWRVFAEKARAQNSRIYLEKFVPFDAECALVCARDVHGVFLKYPLFITEQKNGVCEWALGPSKDFQLEEKLLQILPQIQNFLTSLNYVGVMAFEFFWAKGEFLLNEVAPRVHNSGHITLDAFNYSQFDLHLKAATGFGDIALKSTAPTFVMKNILGTKAFSCAPAAEVASLSSENITSNLYWYGKKESRPGRKMGHLTALAKENPGQSLDELKAFLLKKEADVWKKLNVN